MTKLVLTILDIKLPSMHSSSLPPQKYNIEHDSPMIHSLCSVIIRNIIYIVIAQRMMSSWQYCFPLN